MTKSKRFLEKLFKPFKSLSSDKDTNKEEDLEKIASQEQKSFAFDTLVSATRNFHFSNKLGEGGFGPVYKGKLEDGREIAVKKLARSSRQGEKEFINEAKLLASVQHKNIVNLLGYCEHGVDCLLVYEYLPRQSLDKFLFHPKKREELDWKKRYGIILGVAKGLVYLHEDSHVCIIHRDIKAGNILLDDNWAPKIADFGMARLFPENETHVNTRVAGTNGYMAPEYVMNGKLSAKADVFSFGVLVLELISGQKNSTFNSDHSHSLLEWAWKLYSKGRSLEVMDITLASTEALEQVKLCIQIGLLCCQSDPEFRPIMQRVILILSKKPSSLEEPQKPGFLGSRYRRPPDRPSGTSSAAGSSGLSPHSKPAHFSSVAGSSGGSSAGSSSGTFNSTFNTDSGIRSPHHYRSHEKKPTGFSSSSSNIESAMRSPLHRSHGKKPMQE